MARTHPQGRPAPNGAFIRRHRGGCGSPTLATRRGTARERKGRLRRLLPTLTLTFLLLLPSPASAAWSQSQLAVYRAIRVVFPRHYREARSVFYCESRFDRWAHNPSGAAGVAQLMPIWYEGRFDPYSMWPNLREAHYLFLASGRDWSPWVCQPWGG